MMKRFLSTLGLVCLLIGTVMSQNPQLAQQYFIDGEYEKAATLYKQLSAKNASDHYFDRYVQCLKQLSQMDEAESALKARIKKYPSNGRMYVKLGELQEMQGQMDKADKTFQRALQKVKKDKFNIITLANTFSSIQKTELALKTLEMGQKSLKGVDFNFELANMYLAQGNSEKMVFHYLNTLDKDPKKLNHVKTIFQRHLPSDDRDVLVEACYTRLQDKPNSTVYPEILAWLFVQKKDFKNALRQSLALDKRLKENGRRVHQMGKTAKLEADYTSAIAAFDYVVVEKGKNTPYFYDSQRELLSCKKLALTNNTSVIDKTALTALETEYERFLEGFGYNAVTAAIIIEYSQLLAFQSHNTNRAIEVLEKITTIPNMPGNLTSKAKLQLGDIFLITGEMWESTLLYSQVDKKHKDDALGEQARFKNAMLSFYKGDFDWAQAQFNVLKASTSKLISNDAIDLSVFIMDNLALDTTAAPMKMYAEASLFLFQNKLEEASNKLDSIRGIFPFHDLEDDIHYTLSEIKFKQGKFEQSAEHLESILKDYPESIRCDNALFKLGELYERELKNVEKSMGYYERILLEHSGSTFSVEARKRFRALRGDIQ